MKKLEKQLKKIEAHGMDKHFISKYAFERVSKSEITTYHYTFDGEKYHESSTTKGILFTIACGLS